MQVSANLRPWSLRVFLSLSVGLAVPRGYLPQLLHKKVQRFRGGLVFKAHRLLHHSTLGLKVMKKKKKVRPSIFKCIKLIRIKLI